MLSFDREKDFVTQTNNAFAGWRKGLNVDKCDDIQGTFSTTQPYLLDAVGDFLADEVTEDNQDFI